MGVIVSDSLSGAKIDKFLNKTKITRENNSEKAYRHLVKADALRIKNYFWESIDEYLNSIKHEDINIEAFIGLGLSYKQIGYIKSAVNAFDSAKKLNPFDKQLYFEAGCCYCIDKKFSEAIREYLKALKICPDFLEAKFNLAFTYELNNQSSLAVECYKEITEKNPYHIRAYNNLGSLYMKLDMYKSAIKVFKNQVKNNSDCPRAYLGIAIAFDRLKDSGKALRYYRKYLKLKPNSENLPYILDRIHELSRERTFVENSHLRIIKNKS